MPSYSSAWSEASPAGSDPVSLGDNEIRQLKLDLRERLNTDHWWPSTDDANTGYHRQVTLPEQASDPTTLANGGIIYTKDVSSLTEAFYRDSAGTVIQLTSAGKLNLSVLDDYTRTKTGDWILSTVTTPRTGWTNVSATYSGRFMRISATPLATGGADTHTHDVGSFTAPSHTHSSFTHTQTGHGAQGGEWEEIDNAGDGLLIPTTGYTHTVPSSGSSAITGTSASASNVPVFVQVVVFQKN